MSASAIELRTADAGLSEEAIAVRNALIAHGLETPMRPSQFSDPEKISKIEALMTDVMSTLGLDLSDDSLANTPHRIARMYVQEIFGGLDYAQFPRVSMIENKFDSTEMIRVRDIELVSTCEHHFVTIDGIATVAYVPSSKVIGLSKINRIVRFFGRRPQVQERLTRQIQRALQTVLETEDVGVLIDAAHYCVKARGVQDASSRTQTMALGGRFGPGGSMRDLFFSGTG